MTSHTYQLRIKRSAQDGIARGWSHHEVALEERMTVLDALFHVQREQDASLMFRCACRVGMCGTCAVTIDGKPRLACKTRPSQLNVRTLDIEPLAHLPVIKDLAVSMEPFFEQWKRAQPGFRGAASPTLARIPESSQYAKSTPGKRDCITCGACYAACGIKGSNEEYLGPAAINRAYLRVMDPRDTAHRERLALLNAERSGVWRCHTQFNCTEVCPKGLTLTDSILRLKRLMLRPNGVEKL